MEYSYKEEMKKDIKEYLKENNIKLTENNYQNVYDDLFIDDHITGNGSGSYTMNRELSKEYVLDNMEILKEASEAYDEKDLISDKLLDEEWEYLDVTIRCYLLEEVLNELLESEVD